MSRPSLPTRIRDIPGIPSKGEANSLADCFVLTTTSAQILRLVQVGCYWPLIHEGKLDPFGQVGRSNIDVELWVIDSENTEVLHVTVVLARC
jgi:hypothetical protein